MTADEKKYKAIWDDWFGGTEEEYPMNDGIPPERVARLTLSYEEFSENSPISVTRDYTDENSNWPALLNDFIRFLEAAYGYSIMQRVFIQDNGNPFGFQNWHGGVIKKDAKV